MKKRLKSVADALILLRRERSGLLTLITLAVCYSILQSFIPSTGHIECDEEFYSYYTEVLKTDEESSPAKAAKSREESFFQFDPNALDRDGFVSLGLSPSQADALLKYRNRSGGFQSKEDLGKVFVLPNGWFERHYDDILLPNATPKKDWNQSSNWDESSNMVASKMDVSTSESLRFSPKKADDEPVRIELNTVDSIDLVAIRGVGAKSASNLLKFRSRLGGFNSLEQLDEVWGLHPAVAERLKEVTEITTPTQKINLNTVDEKGLSDHPYVSYKLARSLVAMRSHRGGKLTLDDLHESHLMNDSLLVKLLPYIYVSED